MEIILIICIIVACIWEHHQNKRNRKDFLDIKKLLTEQWKDSKPLQDDKIIRVVPWEPIDEDIADWGKWEELDDMPPKDDKKIFIVTHETQYGESTYMVRHDSFPEQCQVIKKLKIDFNYDDDSLDIFEASITDL